MIVRLQSLRGTCEENVCFQCKQLKNPEHSPTLASLPPRDPEISLLTPDSLGPQATDIYKRLLLESRDDLALNVYVAMCYYKLDYYDVSLEILAVYLQAFPDSAVAMNLKVSGQNATGPRNDAKDDESGTPRDTATLKHYGSRATLRRKVRMALQSPPSQASVSKRQKGEARTVYLYFLLARVW